MLHFASNWPEGSLALCENETICCFKAAVLDSQNLDKDANLYRSVFPHWQSSENLVAFSASYQS